MNECEQADAHRVGRMIRAGRKLRAVSQADLSRQLNITQATFSNIEKGRVAISSSIWFRLSNILNLPTEYAFREGIIDNIDELDDPEKTGLKIPKIYLRHAHSTIRVSQPFLRFFAEKHGEAALESYMRDHLKIDPDVRRIYSLRLSIRFNFDLAAQLIQSGSLKMQDLGYITSFLRNPKTHGKLAAVYDKVSNQVELVKALIEKISLYESNFTYSIINLSRNSLDIESKPTDFMRYFSYREEQLPNFVNLYRASFLESFSQYLRDSKPIRVKILPSNTKRKTECIFRLTL